MGAEASAGPAAWGELLERRAKSTRVPWLIVPAANAGAGSHDFVSYATLRDQSARIAAGLHARGIGTGDRVLVLADNRVPSCLFMLAALALGVTIVPLSPLALGQSPRRWREQLLRVLGDCAPRLLLVPDQRDTGLLQGLAVQTGTVAELASGAAVARFPSVSPDEIAIIQYTSGTTESPRGVMLSHRNLVHNIAAIGSAVDASEAEVGVSWLPTFHDMGLIGGLLFCAYWGMSLVLLRPASFFTRPISWLRAISEFRANCSPAPNFAYQLCADRIPAASAHGLDLSSWRAAFNGADLIQASTLEAFSRRFGASGFRSEAMFPVYGLAENTLAATLPKLGAGVHVDWVDAQQLAATGQAAPHARGPGARGVVCVGASLPGQALRVVASDTGGVLADRQVGEIQLRGPSTSFGYWGTGRPHSADGWLCTGDRGYMVQGALYPVGRLKHVAKHLGRTIDCGFVESTVAGADLLQGGSVAVFGEYDAQRGSDRLVVVAEASRSEAVEQGALRARIRELVRELLSFAPDDVLLVPLGSIPRTTSGKIRHGEASRLYRERGHEQGRFR